MKTVVALLIGACLLTNFVPHRGPPQFRYTGSDPDRPVWNLGWPLVIAIYDPQSGLHAGPFAPVLIPIESLALAAMTVGMNRSRSRAQGRP